MSTGATDGEVVSWRFKGFSPAVGPTTGAEFAVSRPSLFDAGFSWPVMALRESAIDNNIAVLARWCAASGISLAPHGKTTMAPALFERQLAAGAWAMTAATPWQVRMYRDFGVPRVLLANELVDTSFVRWLVDRLSDPGFDFLCYVDSVAGVERLARAAEGTTRPIRVLVEMGVGGGRTGVRTADEAHVVAAAAAAATTLALVGVAGYEGPFGHSRDAETLDAVTNYVTSLGDLLRALDLAGLLDPGADEYVLTCGGSGQIDVVSAALTKPLSCTRPVRPVLRAGSYVTHDNGLYAATSSLAADLVAAVEVWCQVLSRPEAGLALLGAGRRDLSFDAGLPVPLWRRSNAGELSPPRAVVTKLNDQHAFLELDAGEPLDIGDLVCLGISHPCTAHDKWQLAPLLDDERRILSFIRSYF